MQFSSKHSLESKTCEGVTIHLKKFSHKRRAQIELDLADYRAKVRSLMLEYADNVDLPGDPAEIKQQKRIRRSSLDVLAMSELDTRAKESYLRTYITGIDGLLIDEAPATVDTLIADGPVELCDEVFSFIQEHNGLSRDEIPNSESPSISAPLEGGNQSSGIAAPVSNSSDTAAVTVASDTPSL